MGIKGLVVSNAMFKKIALKWQAISARKIALPALDQLRDVMAKMGRYDEMQMIWYHEHNLFFTIPNYALLYPSNQL